MKVKTRTGVKESVGVGSGVEAFLGIPYAKPPVGERRWKAPERLDDSNALQVCDALGCSAMQERDEVELASLHEQSEDCLTLNVWRKSDASEGLPVMVYIHGGAYFSGGSADPLYNGANFAAAHDVVENIAAFGGDPERVTLFGESAGSSSAALLSVCPRAKGLFQRVICESGPIDLYKTKEKGEYFAREIAKFSGCETAQDLLAMSSDEVIAGMRKYCAAHPFEVSLTFAPVCDGTLLPRKPMKAWAEGAARDVDVMIGCTEDEFQYFTFYVTPEEMPSFWGGQLPIHFDDQIDVKRWEDVYARAFPDKPLTDNYIDFMNQTGFFVLSDLMAEQQSTYRPVYNYLFRYKSRIEGMGACHAIEVPFVLKNLDTKDGLEFTGPNPPEHLADEMSDAWYGFAKDGVPATPDGVEWPCYDAAHHVHMVIDENGWMAERDRNERADELFRPMADVLLND